MFDFPVIIKLPTVLSGNSLLIFICKTCILNVSVGGHAAVTRCFHLKALRATHSNKYQHNYPEDTLSFLLFRPYTRAERRTKKRLSLLSHTNE